jgi:hypothetical protein
MPLQMTCFIFECHMIDCWINGMYMYVCMHLHMYIVVHDYRIEFKCNLLQMNINLKSVTCTGLCVILLVLKTSQFFEAACASVMGGKINFKSALLSLLK